MVTNVATGNPEYIQIDSVFEQMDTLRASGSMPFVSKPVAIGDKKYLDGGIADSIPFEWLSGQGCDKLIVVLTRDMEYRKRPMSPILVKLYGRKYPKIAERLLQRHNNYNRAVEELRKWEAGGKAMLFERLYEDNVAGKIDDARFAKMAKRYEQEQGENGKRIKALRLELKQSESKRMDIDDFLTTVRRYTNAVKITKRMVGELIDHIDVYHAEKQDGVTTQRVVIHYNCIGAFDVPDRRKIPEADIIMETRKGVAVSYAPAV